MTHWPSPADITGVSDHQRDVAEQATRGPIGCLTGGPGCGKTRLSGAILRAIAAEHGTACLAAAAAFGKAAVRLTESMQANGVDVEATTVHRLLGTSRNGHDGKGWGFVHNEANPLNKRFLLIDEASTLGVNLSAHLFAACAPGTHVLVVGDTGQLPPVEHGAPLRDMLQAGLPQGELTEIWRNAGDIVHACHAMRRGERYQPSETINLEAGHNLKHFESRTPTMTVKRLENMLLSPPAGIDPVWDVQVLTSVNEKSELSRQTLNRKLQAMLNGGGQQVDGCKLRLRDKVICKSNGFYLGVEDVEGEGDGDDDEKLFVANGEIGRVVRLRPGRVWVHFDCPERTILLKGKESEMFDLAYAITVHKSQGSQWPVVVYVSDDYPGARYVSSRELIYTAISRAEKLAVTIGKRSTIDLDLRREALSKRKTFLKERLVA